MIINPVASAGRAQAATLTIQVRSCSVGLIGAVAGAASENVVPQTPKSHQTLQPSTAQLRGSVPANGIVRWQ